MKLLEIELSIELDTVMYMNGELLLYICTFLIELFLKKIIVWRWGYVLVGEGILSGEGKHPRWKTEYTEFWISNIKKNEKRNKKKTHKN